MKASHFFGFSAKIPQGDFNMRWIDFGGQLQPFVMFSLQHMVPLALLVAAALFIYAYRRKLTKEPAASYTRYVVAVLLVVFEAALYIWYFTHGRWSVDVTLPFQLCSVTFILSVVMLLTRSYRVYEVVYFAGIGGALQALLTPAAILSGFPHFTYFYFFLAHSAIVLSALYMTWVGGFRPCLGSVWRTMLYLNLYLPFVIWINSWTGGNYLFIAHKPAEPSLLDYLGPWPWYIVSMEAAALVMFLLLYLPFAAANRWRRNMTVKEK
jgi:hypothetical integral membrane protein (TIGR02206 family)